MRVRDTVTVTVTRPQNLNVFPVRSERCDSYTVLIWSHTSPLILEQEEYNNIHDGAKVSAISSLVDWDLTWSMFEMEASEASQPGGWLLHCEVQQVLLVLLLPAGPRGGLPHWGESSAPHSTGGESSLSLLRPGAGPRYGHSYFPRGQVMGLSGLVFSTDISS